MSQITDYRLQITENDQVTGSRLVFESVSLFVCDVFYLPPEEASNAGA